MSSQRSRYWWVIWCSSLLLLASFASVAIGVVLYSRGDNPAPVFALAFAIAMVAYMHRVATVHRRSYNTLKQSLEGMITQKLDESHESIGTLLSSKVEKKPNKDLLIESIGELYADVAARNSERKSSSEFSSKPTIMLFGASAVQPRAGDADQASDGTNTSFDIFNNGRNAAEAEGVLFHRYVRLFDDKNFMGRSVDIRKAYIKWLREQIATIERYDGYALINARRAPRWKAIRSSIVSDEQYIDILGDGESGFVIKGHDFAQAQIRDAKKYIGRAKGSKSPILDRYDQSNVGKLKTHLDQMITLQTRSDHED